MPFFTRLPFFAIVGWVCLIGSSPGCASDSGGWRPVFQERLPLYGHRNMIAVVDSAYPAQCRSGVETIATGESQGELVREVLAGLKDARHVRPRVYLDQELKSVAEADAPGISLFLF